MGLHDSFDVLADVLREYRSRGRPVRHVDATTAGGTALRVTLEVPVSLCAASGDDGRAALHPEAATLTDDGGLRVELPAANLVAPPAADAVVSADERAVRVEDDGLVLTVELVVDPAAAESGDGRTGVENHAGDTAAAGGIEDGGDAGAATDGERAPSAGGAEADGGDPARADYLAAARDESVPPYDDTEYLRVLYDSCDSFAEMSREIAMDVSAETVRRYMIAADVHEPTSYDTSSGASSKEASEAADTSSEGASVPDAGDAPDDAPSTAGDPMVDVPEEQLITDGIGLPAGLDLSDVADAVVASRTTYEVHRHLGIGQERTRELLHQLNLQDLVLRRVDGDPDRPVPYEEVAARIRQCVPREA